MSEDEPEGALARGKPADAVLAAELALGVLDPAARARAEARAAQDDAFAADAAAWAAILAPLVEEAAPEPPSDQLWARIERSAGLAAPPPAQVETAPAPVAAPPADPVRRAGPWRALAVTALVVAAACLAALVLVLTRPGVSAGPLLAARLTPPAGGTPTLVASEPLFTAVLDRGRGVVVTTPIGPGPVDPRARRLWLTPKGGAPQPVAVLDASRTRAVPLPPEALRAAGAGATLSVTLEAAEGAADRPTGPVIASGVLEPL